MNDKQVLKLVIKTLKDGLGEFGINGVSVLRNYQVTQQGAESNPAIYIHKISSNRYSYPIESNVYNKDTDEIDTTTKFIRTPVLQFSARVQESTDVDAMTSGDLLDFAADIMQMPTTISTFIDNGIGIEMISQIRDIYEKNDKDNYEHTPNFDLTLSYNRVYSYKTVGVGKVDCLIHSV